MDPKKLITIPILAAGALGAAGFSNSDSKPVTKPTVVATSYVSPATDETITHSEPNIDLVETVKQVSSEPVLQNTTTPYTETTTSNNNMVKQHRSADSDYEEVYNSTTKRYDVKLTDDALKALLSNPDEIQAINSEFDATQYAGRLFNKVMPSQFLVYSGTLDVDKANNENIVEYIIGLPTTSVNSLKVDHFYGTTSNQLQTYLNETVGEITDLVLTKDEQVEVLQNGTAWERLYLSQFGNDQGARDADGNLTDRAQELIKQARVVENIYGRSLDLEAAVLERLISGDVQINVTHSNEETPFSKYIAEWQIHPDDSDVFKNHPRYIATSGFITFVAPGRSAATALDAANKNYLKSLRGKRNE